MIRNKIIQDYFIWDYIGSEGILLTVTDKETLISILTNLCTYFSCTVRQKIIRYEDRLRLFKTRNEYFCLKVYFTMIGDDVIRINDFSICAEIEQNKKNFDYVKESFEFINNTTLKRKIIKNLGKDWTEEIYKNLSDYEDDRSRL